MIGSSPQDAYSKKRIKKPNKIEREQIIRDFRRGKILCLLSTQLADEAIDIPRLNRIILTFPGKHDGRIIQQVGRGARSSPGKNETIVFDMVDTGIHVLERQYALRKKAYKSMKIEVEGGMAHAKAAARWIIRR